MLEDEIDRLIRQLDKVHIQREEAQRAVDRAEERERALIVRILQARRNNPSRSRNPHRVGDIVRIANRLRDEYSIIGVVESSPERLVAIRNQDTRRTYTRGWWNLEFVRQPFSTDDTSQ